MCTRLNSSRLLRVKRRPSGAPKRPMRAARPGMRAGLLRMVPFFLGAAPFFFKKKTRGQECRRSDSRKWQPQFITKRPGTQSPRSLRVETGARPGFLDEAGGRREARSLAAREALELLDGEARAQRIEI